LALRADFPRVPHLNLRKDEFPRSLCLFEEPYSELKLRWTATAFLERIREWLALTAKGKLHAEDQPLEPLLLGSPWPLVIPFDLFTKLGETSFPEPLMIHTVNGGNERPVLIADQEKNDFNKQYGLKYTALALQGDPQAHGIIYQQPNNLAELHTFLKTANIDLLPEMRTRMLSWQKNGYHKDLLNDKLIIIVALPKKRETSTIAETTDLWAFLCTKPISEIGEHIGIWQFHNGLPGLLYTIDQDKRGEQVEVALLNPMYSFSRESAARLNGVTDQARSKVVAIGMGAFGSQVFLNLMRMGFGEWVLIDKDYLLPHNLARHGLSGLDVGYSKVETLALLANQTIKGVPIASAIVADILNPTSKQAEAITAALINADIILDASASVAVARYLACDIDSPARRASLFLNPSGTDAVLLVEDLERKTTLDVLEMQYYRSLIEEQALRNHLQTMGSRIRYARSCRDLSSDVPQDLVALHAAIMSRALRTVISDARARVAIWQTDSNEISTKMKWIDPAEKIQQCINDWTICTDQYLLDKIWHLRAEKLPNETGGVLIGAFDMQRKIVYILDLLPSPLDSTEWPTVYIRGCKELTQRVCEIKIITAGMLGYVGEWHSHPRNCSCTPSEDDRKVFRWLTRNMNAAGLPALVLIVGEDNQYCWYLGQMP
jgi:integrative and conjugative element protein (TIGR02256 family)